MEIRLNTAEMQQQLDRLAGNLREQNKAVAKALNTTAFGATQYASTVASADLDRPVPYTLRGFRYERAKRSPRGLVARTYITPRVGEYLRFAIDGGTRTPRRRAIPVPTGSVQMNQAGNMPKGLLRRLLADPKVFSGTPRGTPRGGDRPAGIWRRSNENHTIKPLVLWEPLVQYDGRQFEYYDQTLRWIERHAVEALRREIDAALAG